ncbi:MAG: phosphotransferase [Myxococcota bacterium]
MPKDLAPPRLEAMLAERFPGVRVAAVHVEASGEGTNSNARLRVEYAGPTEAPTHIFAKLPPEEPHQRKLVLGSGMGRREVVFYQHLASQVPMRVPQVYGAWFDARDGLFALLIEDLETSGCGFPNGEAGVGRELAELAMADFAALHCAGAPGGELERSVVDPPLRQPEYGAAMLEHALATRAEQLEPAFAAVARIYVDRGDAVHDLWEAGVAVVTHGDGHLTNLFVEDDRLGFLDWGCFALAPAMRDVGYFLCMALSVEDRRRHERELIARYLEHCQQLAGSAPSFKAAWKEHCVQSSYTVVAAAPAVLNPGIAGDPNGVYAAHFVRRASAAVADLGAEALLRAELGL